MSAGFVANEAVVTPFVFGKIPAHGDFISRGLDDETVEAGDAAVAEAVALAASHWDFSWDDVYIETPVWRFIAAPGVLGRDWLAGIFMASVDAVGRQFPLLAGFAAPTLALLARSDATALALEETEALARNALLDALSVDTLVDQLAVIAEKAFGDETALRGDPVAVFAGDMLRHLEAAPWGAQALWWVAGGGPEARLRLEGPMSGEALKPLFRRAVLPDVVLAPVAEPDPVAAPEAYSGEDVVAEPVAAEAEPSAETDDKAAPGIDTSGEPATPSQAPADAA